MKRNQIEDKYKWKLEAMFSDDDAWEKAFESLKTRVGGYANFKGKLADKDTLLACLKFEDENEMQLEKLYCYARMRRDEASENRYVEMTDKALNLINELGTASSFVGSEISRIPVKTLLAYADLPEFSEHDFSLREMVRERKHILSEKEERLLSMSDKATNNYQESFMAYNNVDIDFPTINVDGEKVKLTHGKYSFYAQHKDQKVRKAAFEANYVPYVKNINTLCNIYAGSVKADNFYAAARGYKSSLDKALSIDDVPAAVYKNLIKAVNKNCRILHRYVSLRKQALGLNTLHMYDMHVPIVEEAGLSVPYEQAFDMVLEGLKPLGDEYRKLLLKARDTGWIDVMENEGKRSGAYSWGSYGSHPFVLLNYSNTTHDIFTLAHELGHSMHSYYSDKTQPYAKAQYRIFVAEVASTVNEVLLLKSMLKNERDPKLRKFLLSYYLDMFRTTLFRQTMFAEFEAETHAMEDRGEPLTVQSLSDYYYGLNKKYYGRSVKHDEQIRYEWARIPHFYTAFYVYKYATGITSAVNIARRILSTGDTSTYMRFLAAGGSKSPYDILKDAGVDLATPVPYEVAMNEFAETLNELEKELNIN